MDTEYILDCAAELGEVTPVEGVSLSQLPAAYAAVRQLVDANHALPEHFLENVARAALANQAEEVQHWVALKALRAFVPGLRRVLERANCVVQLEVQRALGLCEASPFSALMGVDASVSLALTAESDISEAVVRQVLEAQFGRFKERLGADVDAIMAAVAWYRQDNGARFRKLDRRLSRQEEDGALSSLSAPTMRELAHRRPRQNKSLFKRGQAAIKKATKLFNQLGQAENLRLMVTGQEVTIAHDDSPLKFVLKSNGAPGWLIERTVTTRAHTPYELSVLTKDDVFVARLCVVMEDTPVLDQILALTLFIQAGDELEILSKANWFSFGPPEAKNIVLQAYPQLAMKYPKARADTEGEDLAGTLSLLPEMALQQQWQPYEGRVHAWTASWLHPVIAPVLQLTQGIFSMEQLQQVAMQDG